ncbi:MAG: hypothetical protein JWM56_161 [Candidatus Peribacteria bacterium]|nr:hypothetical protein [Candidatus Peribacteria bacterium]
MEKMYAVRFHLPVPIQRVSEIMNVTAIELDELRNSFYQKVKQLTEAGKLDNIITVDTEFDFAQLMMVSGPQDKIDDLGNFLIKENLGILQEIRPI